MIVCRRCGFHNIDVYDAFCGSCGGFLEWTGEKVAPKIDEELVSQAQVAAAAPAQRRTVIERIQSALLGAVTIEPEPTFAESPTVMPATPAEKPAPTAADRPDANASKDEASGLVAPVSRDSVAAVNEPVVVLDNLGVATPVDVLAAGERIPQGSRRKAPGVRHTAPSRRLRPGDLICGQCGEGNSAGRRFCSRCGAPLTEAEVVRTRWWRRFGPRGGPKVTTLSDSPSELPRTRPGTLSRRDRFRSGIRKVKIVLGLLIILGGVCYGAYPPFRNAINKKATAAKAALSHRVDAHFVPERPTGVTANVATAHHPADLAVDDFANTYWSAAYSVTRYPTLTLTFNHRVTLEKLIVKAGASDAFTAHGRPRLLVLVYSNEQSSTLVARDVPTAQTFSLNHAIAVTRVQIQVQGVFPGLSVSDTAISDVELFGIG